MDQDSLRGGFGEKGRGDEGPLVRVLGSQWCQERRKDDPGPHPLSSVGQVGDICPGGVRVVPCPLVVPSGHDQTPLSEPGTLRGWGEDVSEPSLVVPLVVSDSVGRGRGVPVRSSG